MRVNFSSKTCGPSLRTVQYTIEWSNTFRSASINGGEVTPWVASDGVEPAAGPAMSASPQKLTSGANEKLVAMGHFLP